MASHNRHVVLRAKEQMVPRRHGTLLRSGQGMLLDETTLCATCWMHGVFAAQLTIGNTSFHKLFSVSRDPYNITRSSGLRILIDDGGGWRLLAVPSAFEIGLSDCRWIYRLDERTVTVQAVASGDDPAMQWRVVVEGKPCRFLVFGHLVLGERELDHAGRIEIDAANRRFAFRPDPASLWGQRYPDAVYHLVTSTPDAIETIGGDELLYADGKPRGGPYVALRTQRDERAALRRRGFDDRSRSGRAPRGEVRAWRRRCGDAGAGRTILGARHARPADHRWRTRRCGARYRCSRGSRTTRWCTSPCRMAWSSTGAPRGARATYARARSSSC